MFAAAVSIAGYDAAAHDSTTGDLFAAALLAHLNSPLWRLQHGQVPPLPVLLISTRRDRTPIGPPSGWSMPPGRRCGCGS